VTDRQAEAILQRQKLLEEIRSPWEDIWQDIADHILPIREDIRQERREGERHGTKIYDGSPLSALQLFADGLHGYLISPSFPWFRLQLGLPLHRAPASIRRYASRFRELDDVPEVRQYLQETESCLYDAFRRSTFYNAMTPFFEDGGALGTAYSYSEEDPATGRTIFLTIHPGECYIAEDRYGQVDVVHRKVRLEARKAVQQFGSGAVSDAINEADRNRPFQKFEFLHAVYPRTDRIPGRLDQKNKPIASVWVDTAERKCVRVSGFDMMPYTVWRYKKSTGETYGRCPAMFALADIMGIHQISKTLLGAAHRVSDPAYNVPSELQGKVRLRPGEYNYFGKDHNRVISPVMTGIQYPVGSDREQQKRKAIEDHFHVDFFLMLARSTRQMTATEVLERQGEKAAILGTPIGRLNSETLSPTIDRLFWIEYEAGRLPPLPEILLEMGGESIDVDFLGPLSQAQKRLFRTQNVMNGLEALNPVAGLFPEVLDIIDPDETAREILESNGYPQKAIRSQKDIDARREARAEAERAALEREQADATAGNLKTLAEADRASGGMLSSAAGMEEAGA